MREGRKIGRQPGREGRSEKKIRKERKVGYCRDRFRKIILNAPLRQPEWQDSEQSDINGASTVRYCPYMYLRAVAALYVVTKQYSR